MTKNVRVKVLHHKNPEMPKDYFIDGTVNWPPVLGGCFYIKNIVKTGSMNGYPLAADNAAGIVPRGGTIVINYPDEIIHDEKGLIVFKTNTGSVIAMEERY